MFSLEEIICEGLGDLMKKFYRIRCRLCKTGFLMAFLCYFLALLVCWFPVYWPAFVFCVVVWIVTFLPAFYVEVADKEVLLYHYYYLKFYIGLNCMDDVRWLFAW